MDKVSVFAIIGFIAVIVLISTAIDSRRRRREQEDQRWRKLNDAVHDASIYLAYINTSIRRLDETINAGLPIETQRRLHALRQMEIVSGSRTFGTERIHDEPDEEA